EQRGPPPRLIEPEKREERRAHKARPDQKINVLRADEAKDARGEQREVRGHRPALFRPEPPRHGPRREPEQQPGKGGGEVDPELAVRRRHPPPEPERPVTRLEAVEIGGRRPEHGSQILLLQPGRGEKNVVHQTVPTERRPKQPAQQLAPRRMEREDCESRPLGEVGPGAAAEKSCGTPRIVGFLRPLELEDREQGEPGQREVNPQLADRAEQQADQQSDREGRKPPSDRESEGISPSPFAEQRGRREVPRKAKEGERRERQQRAEQIDEEHGRGLYAASPWVRRGLRGV